MALPWIAPWPTTSCYINGTKLYAECLPSCHKMNGSAFALLHLGLCHCATIFHPSYSCWTRWLVVNDRMPYTGFRLPSPKDVRVMETSYRLLITRDSPLHDGECGKHSVISQSSRVGFKCIIVQLYLKLIWPSCVFGPNPALETPGSLPSILWMPISTEFT